MIFGKLQQIFDWQQSKLTSKSPNSSSPYAVKVECLLLDFCATKWKWKKGELGEKKKELKELDLFASIFIFYYFLKIYLSGCLR